MKRINQYRNEIKYDEGSTRAKRTVILCIKQEVRREIDGEELTLFKVGDVLKLKGNVYSITNIHLNDTAIYSTVYDYIPPVKVSELGIHNSEYSKFDIYLCDDFDEIMMRPDLTFDSQNAVLLYDKYESIEYDEHKLQVFKDAIEIVSGMNACDYAKKIFRLDEWAKKKEEECDNNGN